MNDKDITIILTIKAPTGGTRSVKVSGAPDGEMPIVRAGAFAEYPLLIAAVYRELASRPVAVPSLTLAAKASPKAAPKATKKTTKKTTAAATATATATAAQPEQPPEISDTDADADAGAESGDQLVAEEPTAETPADTGTAAVEDTNDNPSSDQ